MRVTQKNKSGTVVYVVKCPTCKADCEGTTKGKAKAAFKSHDKAKHKKARQLNRSKATKAAKERKSNSKGYCPHCNKNPCKMRKPNCVNRAARGYEGLYGNSLLWRGY
jgi:hypothetical protein